MNEITVITPTVPGREGKLEECKQSVLDQELRPAEHLWMLDKHAFGPAFIRNMIVDQAKTEFVAFLDDDDILLPHHFQRHAPFLDDYDVIFSWGEAIHPDGARVLFDSSYNRDRILQGHNSIPVTATVRRSMFDRVGGFNVRERFEDWALWRDLININARFKCIEEITWNYRIFPKGRNEVE